MSPVSSLSRLPEAGTVDTRTREVRYEYDALDRRLRRTETTYAIVNNVEVPTVIAKDRLLYDTQLAASLLTAGELTSSPLPRIGGEGQGEGAGASGMHNLVQTVNELTGNRTHRFLNGPQPDMVLTDEVFNASGTPTDILWLLQDHQNSVTDVATLPSSGATQATLHNHVEYNAFGAITSQTFTDPKFQPVQTYTGQVLDTITGLLYYDARWYDPKLARFVSEDPIGFKAGDFNLFRYVGNSWPNATDPTGLREPSPNRGVWSSGDVQNGTFTYHNVPDNGAQAGKSVRYEAGHIASGGFPSDAYPTGSAASSTVTLDDIGPGAGKRAKAKMIAEGKVPADFDFGKYHAHHSGPPGSMEMEIVHQDYHGKVAHEGTAKSSKPIAGGPIDGTTCAPRSGAGKSVKDLGRSVKVKGLLIIDIVDTARTSYEMAGYGSGTAMTETVRFLDENGDIFIVEDPLWGAPRRKYVEGSRIGETGPISESELTALRDARDDLYGKLKWDGRGLFKSGTWKFTPGTRSPSTLPIYEVSPSWAPGAGMKRRVGYVDQTGEHLTPLPCYPPGSSYELDNMI